jgi:hypothetical protein
VEPSQFPELTLIGYDIAIDIRCLLRCLPTHLDFMAVRVGGLLASQVVRFLGLPGIFVVGGVLPLAMVPLLAVRFPESVALRLVTREPVPHGIWAAKPDSKVIHGF